MSQRVTVRFPDELLERVHAYVNAENLDNRADALRKIVRDRLDQEGH